MVAPSSRPILLVDDEPHLLFSSRLLLRSEGLENIHLLEDSRQAMPFLAEQEAALVVLDLSMPHISGSELLTQINYAFPQVPVIIMTATNEIETAVECMKKGAFDYLVKPVSKERFIVTIRRALEMRALKEQVSSLTDSLLADRLKHKDTFSGIVTKSQNMQAIFQYVEAIAGTGQPVLISGETGVGKELISKALHALSGRPGFFVAVNAAGLDDLMFSDTLFGHKKGAYTGAERARDGLLIQAEGGTLFLDEVGDLTEASQVRLLRLLQEREYYPLGSDVPRKSDVRILSATNRDIGRMIAEGGFRNDLYYRLKTHHITIPPLRERLDDIPLLLARFLEEAAGMMEKKQPSYPAELITLLSNYRFPGNVRELQTMVFDAVARHSSGVLSMESFKEAVRRNDVSGPVLPPVAGPESFAPVFNGFPTLKEAEEYLIGEALKRSLSNQGIAASLLGLTRQALNKRLSRSK
jgi:two-component system, NtrC family, response regulator HydG